MIWMSGAALRPEGDDHRRLERIDDRRYTRPQLAEHAERCEAAIGKTEDVELLHSEATGGARRLLAASGGELRPGGNMGEVADTLGPIGGDDEMSLAPFPGELRQQRPDDTLVVGVREYGKDRCSALGGCRERRECGERRGDEGFQWNGHPIH